MDIKINDISASEKEVEVTANYDEIKNEIESEVLKQTKKLQMPGFRKGKVPRPMIKKMYGNALEYEASEKVANSKFWEVAKEKHLHPIGKPQLIDIKFEPEQSLYFKVKYEIIPELDVKDYTSLEIEIPEFIVKDEEVENEIKHILSSNRTTEDIEQVNGDNNYIIDVEVIRITENGEPIEGSQSERLQIDLTNERVSPEIISNSKGKKPGEFFNFSFVDEHTHKKDDGEEEIHKETFNYKAEIKGIKKIVLPELNEELIKKVTKDKVSTEAELREQIRTDIQNYYNSRVEDLTKDKLITLIVKNNDFVPPTEFVNNILGDLVKREEEQVKKNGYGKFDKIEAENRLAKAAEFQVKWYLIKNAIEKKENISFSEEELNELAAKDAEKTGIPADKLLNYYKSSNYAEKFIDNKLFDFLKEHNNIKKVAPEYLSQSKEEKTHE